MDTITLVGRTEYDERYSPRDAKKGYVARITGRAPGAVKYAREFLGSSADLVAGDEGLYELQTGKKKGGYTRSYHVVLSHPDHGLIRSSDCEDELAKIAKLLDDGVAIEDAVEVRDLRPSTRVEGLMIFTAVPRSRAAARTAHTAATVESAVDHCWAVLAGLSEHEADRVLSDLRQRVAASREAVQV